MAYQTTYNNAPPNGIVGTSADQAPKIVLSYNVTVGNILAGAVVMQGVDRKSVKPWVAGGTFVGLYLMTAVTNPLYPDVAIVGQTIPVMKGGAIYVQCVDSCIAGNPVYINAAGLLTGTAAGGTIIPGGIWEDTITAGGGVAKLRLN